MAKRGPHEGGLKHQRRSAAMQHYVGLDVSVKETSVCIVDKAGKVIREVKVATEPVAILAVLTDEALAIERIGLEAGALSQWLYSALAGAGLPVICVEQRRVLREQLGVLHRQLLEIVRHDEVCRRLMTTPGVGPVVALTFRATVDVPSRFTSSKAVGAVFGLTPRRHQSGEIDRMGAISKCGDAMMREMLFEAALVLMTHSRKWSWLKAWGMKIARHRGMKRAIVAVARRLAVIMH